MKRATLLLTFAATLLFLLLDLWPATALAGFIGGLLHRSGKPFRAGFAGAALAWLALLAERVLTTPSPRLLSTLLGGAGLPEGLWLLFALLTLLLGGLLGGLGSHIGGTIVRLLRAEESPTPPPGG